MKRAIIWDLDGTLLDSYDVIVESIYLTLSEYNIQYAKEEIHSVAINSSIKVLFADVARKTGVDQELLQRRYSEISAGKYKMIKPEKQAYEALQCLAEKGFEHYVFTHRGKTTIPVLDHLQMRSFFKQIITSQSGYKRKPHPEGLLHLIKVNQLDPEHTYYVGDRKLDMECAKNAGIAGILYMPKACFDVAGAETFTVKALLEIPDIVK